MFLIFMNIFATFFASHPAPDLSPSALGSVSKVHPDRTAFPYFGPRHLLTGIVCQTPFLTFCTYSTMEEQVRTPPSEQPSPRAGVGKISLKSQVVNSLGLRVPHGLCHNYTAPLMTGRRGHRQHIKERTWLCSTLFTKTSTGRGPRFADPCPGGMW